ncbi:MAG: sulfotransferase domain-containing protein [Alphaproteobacteria bacterium]|nr:sulfotransferase domain-containing protein [Alphaproteobacteria bacterium]
MSGFYWITSFPKSGNTWIRMALWALSHGRPLDFDKFTNWIPMAARRVVFDEVLAVESADLTVEQVETLRPRLFEALACDAPEPLLRKVHEAWVLTPAGEPLFPSSVTLGAIYIVRDPRDVAVAVAHHFGMPFDAAIDFLASPDSRVGPSLPRRYLPYRMLNWGQHVEGWLDAPSLRVLLVRYEDMLADAPAALGHVAAFLGWDTNSDAIGRAAEATRFERLRAEEERGGFREKPPGMGRFFRRGQAGGWRDTLTPEQAARIERNHGTVMARLGYL